MSTYRPDAPELLRWWHQHQAQKLNRISENIRNDLLQELCAIRRQLEVSCATETAAAAFGCDRHLTNLEHIYNQLEHFSYDLKSPFLDSLPLALQHVVQPWISRLPLSTEFPEIWCSEPVEHIQLLITVVDSFLSQLATSGPQNEQPKIQRCGIALTQQVTAKALICYATGDVTSIRLSLEPLLPLLETFRLLTQGEYSQTIQSQMIRWELRWHSPPPNSPIAPPHTAMTAPTDRIDILVVDDHEAILRGTVSALEKEYPNATIRTATTAKAANEDLARGLPDLLIMDLSIPLAPGEPSQTEVGIELLRQLLNTQSTLNIAVQSAHVKSLIRLKPSISDYPGGFTITDKNLPLRDMLEKVEWARKGLIYTPRDMRIRLEIKPEWMKMLQLAFDEGLQDKTIAGKLNVSERTVRHYWNKVQDALGVYPEAGKNIRIQTEIRAREEGLID